MVESDGRYHRRAPRAEGERQIVVWDTRTGRTVASLGNASGTTGVALCPDGSLLALCGQEATLLSLPSGKVWGRFGTCTAGVAFSSDGRRLLTSTDAFAVTDGSGPRPTSTLQSWSLQTWQREGSIPSVRSLARLLRVFAMGTRAATASAMSADIEVWGMPRGPRLHLFQMSPVIGPREVDVGALAVSPPGQWLAAAADDPLGRVSLWSLGTGRRLRELRTSRGVFRLAASPRGRFLAVAEHGGALSLWRVGSGR